MESSLVYCHVVVRDSFRNPQTTAKQYDVWKLIHSNWGKIQQHDFILNTATTVLSVKPHVIWPTKQGWGRGVYRSSPLWRKQREESEEVEGRGRSVYRHCCDWSPESSMTVLSARWRKNEDKIQVKLVKYFIVFLFLAKAYLLAFLPPRFSILSVYFLWE